MALPLPPGSVTPKEERRSAPRHAVSFPTRIDTKHAQDCFGMAQNVSRRGVLVATPTRLRIGDQAYLSFRVRDTVVSVAGRTVRLELNPDDASGFGCYLAAFSFTDELPHPIALLTGHTGE